jgi:hypothetical protein
MRLPSATEWMAGATVSGDPTTTSSSYVLLQWSSTPCEQGGNIAFLAQSGSTFAVCSDVNTGGLFRVAAEMR